MSSLSAESFDVDPSKQIDAICKRERCKYLDMKATKCKLLRFRISNTALRIIRPRIATCIKICVFHTDVDSFLNNTK